MSDQEAKLHHEQEALLAKRELRYTKKRLRRLLQIGRIGFFEWNLGTNMMACSGDFESLYGLAPGTFNCTFDGWTSLIHPEDLLEVQRKVEQSRETGTFRADWRVIFPQGEVRWIEGRGSIIRGAGRNAACMVGVHVDITVQKQLEEELNSANMFLERIMHSVSSALFVLDPEQRIIKFNDAASTLTGYDCTALLTQPFGSLFESAAYAPLSQALHRLTDRTEPHVTEGIPLATRERKGVIVELTVTPLRGSGKAMGSVAVVRDVTEEREVQERLRENEQRYRTIFDAANDGFFIHCAASGTILDVNRRAQEMYGYTRDEMCLLTVGDLSGSSFSQDRAMEVMHRVAAGEPQMFEWLGRDSHGREFWVEVNLKKVVLEGKDRLLAVVRDISERKRATEALQESEEKFRTLADNIAQFAWMADAAGNIFWYNQRWLDYTGRTLEEMEGEGWKTVQHPEHLERVAEKLSHCFRTGTDWEDIMPLRSGSGEYRWFLSRAIPIRDRGGNVIRWFGTNTDITEQRETEEALRKTEERLSLAQAAADIGIWNWDLRTNESSVTEQYLKVLGIPHRPESLEAFFDMIDPEDRDRVRKELEEAVAHAKQFENQFRITGKDGTQRWIMGRGKVYSSADRTPDRIAGIIFDITERKLAEENLKKTMEELSRSNRELEQFAYVASHDLQEPLRMVTSYLRLLERKYKSALDEKADEYIHFAVDGAARMHQLIEGLLTYSRIARSGPGLRPVDTEAIFDAAVANLQSQIAECGGRITRGALPNLRGDPILLMQLFQNLISNGLKYRRADVPPEVSASCHRDGKRWVFAMRDNGIGIEKKHFERIFQLFQRLHTRQEFEGTGIGLASCKKIIERHGGQIWIESSPGEGSTFFFTIPL